MKQKLLITESKMLGRILGPAKERNGTWRMKTNVKLNNLIKKNF
jgi:hypothetical protein